MYVQAGRTVFKVDLWAKDPLCMTATPPSLSSLGSWDVSRHRYVGMAPFSKRFAERAQEIPTPLLSSLPLLVLFQLQQQVHAANRDINAAL